MVYWINIIDRYGFPTRYPVFGDEAAYNAYTKAIEFAEAIEADNVELIGPGNKCLTQLYPESRW